MQDKPGDFRLERGGRVRLHFTGAANSRQLAGLPLDLFTYPASSAKEGQPVTNASKSLKAKDQDTLEVGDVLPGRCELRFHGDAEVPYTPTRPAEGERCSA